MESVVAQGRSTAAGRTAATRLRSLQRFVDVARLQHAPPKLQIESYICAMLRPGSLSDSERVQFTARAPGEPGAGRKGTLSFSTARSYMATLSRERGVPTEDLVGLAKGMAADRRLRREPLTQASPLDAAAVELILADLGAREAAEPELLAAGALAWAGALRMADLRSIRAQDVVVEERALAVRVVWWEAKEVRQRGTELPMRYSLPHAPLRALVRCLSGAGGGYLFTEGCVRRLVAATRRRCPQATGHSWRRGALQHLTLLGATWDQVSALARHQTRGTTRLYLRGAESPDTVLAAAGSRLISDAMRR